jgi:hypothetical protein
VVCAATVLEATLAIAAAMRDRQWYWLPVRSSVECGPPGPTGMSHQPRSLRSIAFMTHTASVTRILRQLGEPTQPPRAAPRARPARMGVTL